MNQTLRLVCPLLSVLVLWLPNSLSAEDFGLVWRESFEGPAWQDDWSISNGTWEVGEPTSGPGFAHRGTRCAATTLGGDYVDGTETRLQRRTPFVVPDASQSPRLRFWHWFSLSTRDLGVVEVRGEDSQVWQQVSVNYVSISSRWTRAIVDLSDFAGETIEIGFRFRSLRQDFDGFDDVSSGWYIDDIELVTGDRSLAPVESFESGISDWHAERGIWQAGPPASGPGVARSGVHCAGTVLDGNYQDGQDSRWISPPVVVPDGHAPRLVFWHWFSLSTRDSGQVELRAAGESNWVPISTTYTSLSSRWTRAALDVAEFAGQTVELGFRFRSLRQDFDGFDDVSSGWYIDDIKLLADEPRHPASEDFEAGIGDWHAERGIWQVGVPSSGPGAAWSGDLCAATVLDDDYPDGQDSRLISAPFTVPIASRSPRLSFWHWFSLSTRDSGVVEVRRAGSEEWIPMSTALGGVASVWTRAGFDLVDFGGETIEIGFRFRSARQDNDGFFDVSSGWYIDNVELRTGEPELSLPEGFESGLGDWRASRGLWQVGVPSAGPDSARGGTHCAGTVLDGDYPDGQATRLISPPWLVPDSGGPPSLRFWHWHSFSTLDSGRVQVRSAGEADWEDLSDAYTGTSDAWGLASLPLDAWAGQRIEVAFLFTSAQQNFDGVVDVSSGWYLDDISIEPAASPHTFQRGDSNGDGNYDITDPIALLAWLFGGGLDLPCEKAADADDSGVLDISDAVYSLRFLFANGAEPPAPFGECGADGSADSLRCAIPTCGI